MKNSTFVRWVMAFVFTLMSCAPSFACCTDANEAKPAATQSVDSSCLNSMFGDCKCSNAQCGAECDKCKNVIEVRQTIKMHILDGSTCTVGVDREICRIIYVPPSSPVRQCFKTHEDVKGTPSADGKCCQVVVDGRQYCVKEGGSIYVPGLVPGEGFTTNSLFAVTKRVEGSKLTVDGKRQVEFETTILAVPTGCCAAASDHKQGDECVVQVTRQQCTWVGGSPGQPPHRVCWTTREDTKGKWSGNCCTVTVDGRQYCVEEGGGIYVPGVLEGERLQPSTGTKSLLNKILTAPLNALKALVDSVKRPFKR